MGSNDTSTRLLTCMGEWPTAVSGMAAPAGAAAARATQEEDGPGWACLGRRPRQVGPA
jgi:hypothetical protein